MKHTIFVELFEEHEKVNIYTIRFLDQETETDLFFSEFDVPEFEDDIDIIITAIDKIVENGALERYFRPEGGKLKAIPLNSSQLRLYCYLVNEEIMILGNGGQKTTRTVNEDPILTKHTEILRGVGNMLSSRINKDTVQAYKKQLYGNLEFQLEVKE